MKVTKKNILFLIIPVFLFTTETFLYSMKPKSEKLFEACEKGDINLAKLLIAKGAKVNAQDKDGLSPLILACHIENIDLAKLLIAKGANVNAKDNNNLSPLMHALYMKQTNLVKLFIAKGADVNAICKEGDTPLINACYFHKNISVIKLLIAKGANVNAQNKDGDTPLIKAFEYTLSHDRNIREETYLAKFLIAKGADINAQDKDGNTPLIRACSNENINLATFLIAKGADINAQNKDGDTPLIRACSNENINLAKFLIAKGAKVNATNTYGSTPLIGACYNGNINLAKFLIAKGAQVNATNTYGNTSLMGACYNGNIDLATFLIAKGAHVNAQNNEDNFDFIYENGLIIMIYGHNPLVYACYYHRNIDLSKLLIAVGADIFSIRDYPNDRFINTFAHQLEKDALLRTHMKDLTIDNNNHILSIHMKEKAEKINKLMLDPLTPIYTKQLALPSLLEYHQTCPEHLTNKQLLAYCNQIVFNYTFFSDKQYKKIRNFAIKHNAKDICGKSILVAAAYLPKGLVEKPLSKLFETKGTLYRNTGLFKKWRAQCYPSLFKKFITTFSKRSIDSPTNQEKTSNDFINALTIAKRIKNKGIFKLLMNYAINLDCLKGSKKSNVYLPPEVVGKILSYI